MILDCKAGDQDMLEIFDRTTGLPLDAQYVTYADDERGFYRACVLDDKGSVQVDPENQEQVWQREYAADIEIRLHPRFASNPHMRRWFAERKEEAEADARRSS